MAFLLFVPTTILSGCTKSLIASPSRKNSGLETTSNNFLLFFFLIIFSILSPVVKGTVDLITIILYLLIYLLICFETWYTYFKLAELFFLFAGVPTQIKTISDFLIAFSILFVKIKRFCLWFFLLLHDQQMALDQNHRLLDQNLRYV